LTHVALDPRMREDDNKNMEKIQKIGVTAFIINKENKLLIIRRTANATFLPGYYEMPGGHVEFGESPEEALKREIGEEVNLKIESAFPYNIFSYVSGNGNKHTIDIQFIAKVAGEIKIKLSQEHEDFVWATEEQLNEYEITAETKDAMLKGFKIIRN